MTLTATRPNDFSAYLFWDTDISALDIDRHAIFIIDRVLSLGTMEDFRLLKSCYGDKKITAAVKGMRYLDARVLHFCSLYFNIPFSDFRCYTQKPSTPSHWQY